MTENNTPETVTAITSTEEPSFNVGTIIKVSLIVLGAVAAVIGISKAAKTAKKPFEVAEEGSDDKLPTLVKQAIQNRNYKHIQQLEARHGTEFYKHFNKANEWQ